MGSIDLPDINVWLALVDPDHQHHERASGYWEKESAEKIVFTRITMLGLLRLLSNHHVMKGQPFSPNEAWGAYDALRDLPEVAFLEEPDSTESKMKEWSTAPDFPPSRLTDAWIAAVAFSTQSRLVSFDSDYRNFAGLSFLHLAAEQKI
ncbi:MAG: PIN domain-containing protein [Chthoniobacterales bacterium]|nr:PIN domain-containing protein [Chthoniobacterales bacterium]